MQFEHRFTVRAPQAQVAAFHTRADGLRAITPTPMTIHSAPDPLTSGDEIHFTMWVPFPLRWHGRVENVSDAGFDDLQVNGPFKRWQHRHNFLKIDDTMTEVYDVVQAELPRHPLKLVVAAGMWLSLPLLFAYRGWRTRKLVEKQ